MWGQLPHTCAINAEAMVKGVEYVFKVVPSILFQGEIFLHSLVSLVPKARASKSRAAIAFEPKFLT